MKAERRHELKTNALARGIENAPQIWRDHGNKLMLVLIGVLLVIILVRYRMAESALREKTAKDALSKAEAELAELQELPFWRYPEEAIAVNFSQAAGLVEDDVNAALKSADDPAVRARAYLARGNLNLIWARFPALPVAATRPSLKPQHSREEYLTSAENAYNEVLRDPLSRNHEAVWSARLGLAAAAEERGDWDAAKKDYEAIANDSAAPTALKDYAKQREEMLADLRKKPYFGTATTIPSVPSTRRVILGPEAPQTTTAVPSTAPAQKAPSSAPVPVPPTQPATAPALQPTSAPTTRGS